MNFGQFFALGALATLAGLLVVTVWSFASCLRNGAVSKRMKTLWAFLFFFTAPISSLIYPWIYPTKKSLRIFSAILIVVCLGWIAFFPKVKATYYELARLQGINTEDY